MFRKSEGSFVYCVKNMPAEKPPSQNFRSSSKTNTPAHMKEEGNISSNITTEAYLPHRKRKNLRRQPQEHTRKVETTVYRVRDNSGRVLSPKQEGNIVSHEGEYIATENRSTEAFKDGADLNELYLRDVAHYLEFHEEEKKPHVKMFKAEGKTTLVLIAEKNSVARAMAEVLSRGNMAKTTGRYSTFEFQASFWGRTYQVRAGAVAGHVFSRDFPARYNNWISVDPSSLFAAETLKVLSSSGLKIALETLCRNADILVLCLDNDAEGENISFEVLDIGYKAMHIRPYRQVYRLRFSALTPEGITSAFAKLEEGPDMAMSLAVDARQILDLKLGVAFTRYLTLQFKQKFSAFQDRVVSYGPCQTPALALVCVREEEIEQFRPQRYFTLSFEALVDDKSGGFLSLEALFEMPRFDTRQAAECFKSQIPDRGQLVEVVEEKQRKTAKEGLNSVGLMYGLSKMGMRSYETMEAAENLYLQGFITYPRTESTRYPSDYPFHEVLKEIIRFDPAYKTYIQELLARKTLGSTRGVDVGDHPPICPTTSCPSNLPSREAHVYSFVVRHFLATLGEDCLLLKTRQIFNFGKFSFNHTSTRVLRQGFTAVLKQSRSMESSATSPLHTSVKWAGVHVLERMTQPPSPMTEAELIRAMEAHHIGTDASMAKHIQTIVQRGYVQFKEKRLEARELGRLLISTLRLIDPDLVDANLRMEMELRIAEIAKNYNTYPRVLEECIKLYHQKYISLVTRER